MKWGSDQRVGTSLRRVLGRDTSGPYYHNVDHKFPYEIVGDKEGNLDLKKEARKAAQDTGEYIKDILRSRLHSETPEEN